MTDEELERKIRAATPGPWGTGDGNYPGSAVRSDTGDVCETAEKVENTVGAQRAAADADFIAALDPVAALALLNRARASEAKVERLRLVGAGLANAAYNLKQQSYIPEEHRRSLDEGQRAWDAVLAGGTTPSLLDEYCATESERAAVLTVARAAAEDMREKAKALATSENDLADTAHRAAVTEKTSAYWDARRDQAKVLEKRIGALPLPGDKP